MHEIEMNKNFLESDIAQNISLCNIFS